MSGEYGLGSDWDWFLGCMGGGILQQRATTVETRLSPALLCLCQCYLDMFKGQCVF